MKFCYIFLSLLFVSHAAFAISAGYTPRLHGERSGGLIVHNRIVAKVNDKTISVIDVMKKMDAYLLEYSPDALMNREARAQFLMMHWKEFLSQMIENELIFAEALEKEMKVSDGEVRKELQERFGPNLIENLDKMGLTFSEAFDLVKKDMLVQAMSWHHINAKALQKVGPSELKKAYKNYTQANPPKETFQYEVMSFSGKTKEQSEKYAQIARHIIAEKKVSLHEAEDLLKQEIKDFEDVKISFSSQTIDGKSISKNLKETLLNIAPSGISDPVMLAKRSENDTTVKVYMLKDRTVELPTPFIAIENKLKTELLQKAANEESAKFVQWLKNKYSFKPQHLEEMCPSDFQPFSWMPG